MYTKSIIQQEMESIEHVNKFFENLKELTDMFVVENSIFIPKNNTMCEATAGYFCIDGEYNSLDELKSNYNLNSPYVRVINNSVFQCGNVYNRLNECKSESHKSIYDIRAQKIID